MIVYCIVTAFLNVLSSVVLGLAVLLRDPRRRQNQLFSWFTASFALWSLFYLLWQFSASAEEALLYSRLLLGCSTFIPISYYHFVTRLAGRVNRYEIQIGYVIAVVIAAFTPTPYLVSHVEPELMFPYWPKGGPVFVPYSLLFSYYTVRAWMVLLSAFRRSSHARRNQLFYVCFCTIVGWIGGLTNFLLWFDVPIPPVGNGLALVYIVGVGYAMIRFRLVEINLLVVRLISYGLVVVALTPVMPLALWTAHWLTGWSVLPKPAYFVVSLLTTGCIFVASYLLKIRVDRLLEGTLLREEFRGRSRLRHLAQQIASISDEEKMFEEVVESVRTTLDTGGAAIAVRGELEAEITPVVSSGFPAGFRELFRLDPDDPIVRLVQRSRKAVLLEEIEMESDSLYSHRARALRMEHGVAAIVPIHADTIFFGVLILRPRARHRLFSGADLSLLEAICLQIGLNVRSRQLERRASQAEKLISLGTLAAGLAHELRNPLVSIQTFAGLLKENGDDREFQREFSEIMQRDVARIVGIVENISSFATRDSVEFTYLQVGEVIKAAYDITKSDFRGAGVSFDFEYVTMPPVHGNYNQLLQVFINLFQNGVQAINNRENGRIEVRLEHRTRQVINPSVEVTIRDNGDGIDLEVLPRIFEPFVTTKSTGVRKGRGGMGLGLAIVKRIVDGHHGVIRAASTLGQGTEFTISLPTDSTER
ncbi:MAG: ATP-binding protein [Opitutaceae bacterium]